MGLTLGLPMIFMGLTRDLKLIFYEIDPWFVNVIYVIDPWLVNYFYGFLKTRRLLEWKWLSSFALSEAS